MVKQELSIYYLLMILMIFLQELGEGVFQEGKPDTLTRLLKIKMSASGALLGFLPAQFLAPDFPHCTNFLEPTTQPLQPDSLPSPLRAPSEYSRGDPVQRETDGSVIPEEGAVAAEKAGVFRDTNMR